MPFADFNCATKSPKILENVSTIILIIVDFNEYNRLIINMKQLPSEFFKSVAFFLGRPVGAGALGSAAIRDLGFVFVSLIFMSNTYISIYIGQFNGKLHQEVKFSNLSYQHLRGVN